MSALIGTDLSESDKLSVLKRYQYKAFPVSDSALLALARAGLSTQESLASGEEALSALGLSAADVHAVGKAAEAEKAWAALSLWTGHHVGVRAPLNTPLYYQLATHRTVITRSAQVAVAADDRSLATASRLPGGPLEWRRSAVCAEAPMADVRLPPSLAPSRPLSQLRLGGTGRDGTTQSSRL